MKLKTIDQIPDYKAAMAKRTDLQLRRQSVAQRLARMEALREMASATDAKALAILDGAPGPGEDSPTADALAKARDELRVLDRAIDMQTSRIESIRNRLASEATAELMPRYRAIMAKQVELAVAMAAAHEEESQFLSAFEDAGYTFNAGSRYGLRRFTFEASDVLAINIEHMIELGVLDPKEPCLHRKEWSDDARAAFARAAKHSPTAGPGAIARVVSFLTGGREKAAA